MRWYAAYRFGGKRVSTTNKFALISLMTRCGRIRVSCCGIRNFGKEYERRLAAPPDSSHLSSLKKQVAAAERSVTRLIDAYTDGVLERSEFDPRLQRARQRVVMTQQVAELEQDSREQATLREALACLDD